MEGFRLIEVPVSTNPRFSGTSHYGVWNRLFKSFRDLLGVRWMNRDNFDTKSSHQLIPFRERRW
jgi:hypothetical protein